MHVDGLSTRYLFEGENDVNVSASMSRHADIQGEIH